MVVPKADPALKKLRKVIPPGTYLDCVLYLLFMSIFLFFSIHAACVGSLRSWWSPPTEENTWVDALGHVWEAGVVVFMNWPSQKQRQKRICVRCWPRSIRGAGKGACGLFARCDEVDLDLTGTSASDVPFIGLQFSGEVQKVHLFLLV